MQNPVKQKKKNTLALSSYNSTGPNLGITLRKPSLLNLMNQIKFVEHLRIKMGEKSLTQCFDVAMTDSTSR